MSHTLDQPARKRAADKKTFGVKFVENESPWKPLSERSMVRKDKKHAMLKIATQLFNEKGYNATSLDEIALKLNVTKPTVYYYFKSKDEILFESVLLGLKMIREGIDQVRSSGGRSIDQLKACMTVYSQIVMEDFGRCLICVGEDPLPADKRVELRRLKGDIDKEFRKLVQGCISEGSFRKCDPKLAAFSLAGALSWIGRWYEEGGKYSREEISAMFLDIVLNGLVAN